METEFSPLILKDNLSVYTAWENNFIYLQLFFPLQEYSHFPCWQRCRQDFGSGETRLRIGLVGVRGWSHPDAGVFSKIFKHFLIAKLNYFSIFFKKLNKPRVQFFTRLDLKHKLLGNFEKILTIFDKNSIEKLNF